MCLAASIAYTMLFGTSVQLHTAQRHFLQNRDTLPHTTLHQTNILQDTANFLPARNQGLTPLSDFTSYVVSRLFL